MWNCVLLKLYTWLAKANSTCVFRHGFGLAYVHSLAHKNIRGRDDMVFCCSRERKCHEEEENSMDRNRNLLICIHHIILYNETWGLLLLLVLVLLLLDCRPPLWSSGQNSWLEISGLIPCATRYSEK
jgi:hypothetical protein